MSNEERFFEAAKNQPPPAFRPDLAWESERDAETLKKELEAQEKERVRQEQIAAQTPKPVAPVAPVAPQAKFVQSAPAASGNFIWKGMALVAFIGVSIIGVLALSELETRAAENRKVSIMMDRKFAAQYVYEGFAEEWAEGHLKRIASESDRSEECLEAAEYAITNERGVYQDDLRRLQNYGSNYDIPKITAEIESKFQACLKRYQNVLKHLKKRP